MANPTQILNFFLYSKVRAVMKQFKERTGHQHNRGMRKVKKLLHKGYLGIIRYFIY
jgi:hypothetical protein